MSVSSEVAARFGRWVRLVTAGLQGGGDPYEVLARPDVSVAWLADLEAARSLALGRFAAAWPPAASAYREGLLRDIESAYAAEAAVIRAAVIRAWRAAGGQPEGSGAARRAAEQEIMWLALRNELTVSVAGTRSAGESALAEAGPGDSKKWSCRKGKDGKPDERVCEWCRYLDSLPAIPARQEFSLAGHRSSRRPPRVYRDLLVPPCHPNCRCIIILVRPATLGLGPVGLSHPPDHLASPASLAGRFIAAASVRSLPEGRYRALRDFYAGSMRVLGRDQREAAHG